MLSKKTKQDIISSWGSACAAVVMCSPLEVVKMNAQVTSTNLSVRGMFKNIYKTHGTRGFYTGLMSSMAAQPGYWVLYWPIYNALKDKYTNPNPQTKIPIVFASSLIASMAVNPLFVFKTRFQTSVLKNNGFQGTYTQLARSILEKEGWRGFYKGNFVAQIKNTQMILQMPLYDYLNTVIPLSKSNFVLMDRSFVSGLIAKTFASCIVFYPIDTIRTNIRDNVQHRTITQIIKEIHSRPGGIFNFYRGVGVYWLSSVPTFGMIMFIYEKFQRHFATSTSTSTSTSIKN